MSSISLQKNGLASSSAQSEEKAEIEKKAQGCFASKTVSSGEKTNNLNDFGNKSNADSPSSPLSNRTAFNVQNYSHVHNNNSDKKQKKQEMDLEQRKAKALQTLYDRTALKILEAASQVQLEAKTKERTQQEVIRATIDAFLKRE